MEPQNSYTGDAPTDGDLADDVDGLGATPDQNDRFDVAGPRRPRRMAALVKTRTQI